MTGSRNIAVVLTVVLTCLSPSHAEDWPAYRHDNTRSGVTRERLVPPLELGWSFRPTHPPQPSWPHPKREPPRVRFDDAFHVAVSGQTAFFGSSADGKVYALDMPTGNVKWDFITGGAVRLAPSVWHGRVYFGSDDGYVYCLAAADGTLGWRGRAALENRQLIGRGRMISVQPPRGGVIVDDGVAYFAAGIFPAEGVALTAVDANTGKPIWRNDTFGSVYQQMPHGGSHGFTGISPQGYLLASAQRIYVPSGRSVPAAFDRGSGKLLFWHGSTHHSGGAWALLADDTLYSGAPHLLPPEATDDYYDSPQRRPSDGTKLRNEANRLMGRDAITGGDRLVVSPGDRIVVTSEVSYMQGGGFVTALDRKAYASLGARKKGIANKLMSNFWRCYKPSYSCKVIARRRKSSKKLSDADQAAFDQAIAQLKPGHAERDKLVAEMEKVREQIAAIVKWRCRTDCGSELILAGDVLYVGGEGKVSAIDTRSGKVIWTGQVEGTARGLAVSDGRLLVSCDNGHLYCFGKDTVSSPRVVKQSVNSQPYPEDALTAAYGEMADEIVRRAGVKRGFCLVYGCGEGRLLYELARRTDLQLYGYEPDAAKVVAARRKLAEAGMLGVRANVFQADLSRLPCNDYFANLIVSENIAVTGRTVGSARELFRVLRPCGGVALLGQSTAMGKALEPLGADALAAWLAELPDAQRTQRDGAWAKVVRGLCPARPIGRTSTPTPETAALPAMNSCAARSGCSGSAGRAWPESSTDMPRPPRRCASTACCSIRASTTSGVSTPTMGVSCGNERFPAQSEPMPVARAATCAPRRTACSWPPTRHAFDWTPKPGGCWLLMTRPAQKTVFGDGSPRTAGGCSAARDETIPKPAISSPSISIRASLPGCTARVALEPARLPWPMVGYSSSTRGPRPRKSTKCTVHPSANSRRKLARRCRCRANPFNRPAELQKTSARLWRLMPEPVTPPGECPWI